MSILFVLTSHSLFLDGTHPTGWYAPEAAHPYKEVTEAGFKVVFASPAGGKAPLDPSSVEAFKEDAVTVGFLNDPLTKHAVENTLKLADVNHTDFLAIFYVGGHGPVFDLATDQTNIALAEAFLAAGKPVGALCHGPAALSNVKSNGGESIFKGRRVTCFSNQEEEMVGLAKAIPFLPETDIVAKGGIFVKERQPWGEEVVVDKTGGKILITGANPASATATGRALVAALK